MISDEPDEDADNLDDETLLQTYLGAGDAKPAATDDATDLRDWPQRRGRDLGLNLDAETLAWFKAGHVDWGSTMASIIRAFVAAQTGRERVADTAAAVPSAMPAAPHTQPASDPNANA